MSLGGEKGSELSTGGMHTKLRAAKNAVAEGTETVIANSDNPDVLYDIAEGREVGTRFIVCKD